MNPRKERIARAMNVSGRIFHFFLIAAETAAAAVALTFFLLAAPLPPESGAGQEAPEGDAAAAFLEAARKEYALPLFEGLESFRAEVRIFAAEEKKSRRNDRNRNDRAPNKDVALSYSFEAPDTETIDIEGLPARIRKTMGNPLRGLWKDVAAGCVFPDTEGEARGIEGTGEGMILTITPGKGPSRRIVFDPETKRVVEEVIGRGDAKTVIRPSYASAGGKMRLEGKVVSRSPGKGGEGTEGIYVYGGFRKISGFDLPTRLKVDLGRSTIDFILAYKRINKKKAEDAGTDPAAIKALAADFEKRYGKLSSSEKIDAMKELAATCHEIAAKAIAAKGLADRDAAVRAEAAKCLGAMGCRNVVPHLTRAMKTNSKDTEVFLALVDALGEIGDPRAIPSLADDFWGWKDRTLAVRTGRAKIGALGRIRSKKAVDALMDLLYKFGRGRHGSLGGLLADVDRSLGKLTGQSFGKDRQAWKDWWRKNKARFKLEEDK